MWFVSLWDWFEDGIWVGLEVKAGEGPEFCKQFQQEKGRPGASRNVSGQGYT